MTNTLLEDSVGHGTHMANVIADRIKNVNYCTIIVKWFAKNQTSAENIANTIEGFKYIDTLSNISLVMYSAGGATSSVEERDAILALTLKGVKVFVAAGNENNDLDLNCNFFPACYNISNVEVVGSLDKNDKKQKLSNYGKKVTKWELGEDVIANAGIYGNIPLTGTSQANAIAVSKYLNELGKK